MNTIKMSRQMFEDCFGPLKLYEKTHWNTEVSEPQYVNINKMVFQVLDGNMIDTIELVYIGRKS